MWHRRQHSVRAAVVAAACVVAAMTVVAGAVSGFFYARVESLLLTVAEEQSAALAYALRLAETSNRYAAGGGEIEAARNQLQRQNATVALAQHAQGLYEVIAALRRVALTAAQMDGIEALVTALENNLFQMNRLVERRIELEAAERRNRAELEQARAALDSLLARPATAAGDTGGSLEAAGARVMLHLYEAGQSDRPAAVQAARTAFGAARAHLDDALAAHPEGAAAAGGGSGPLTRLDRAASGPDGIFAVRESLLNAHAGIARHAVLGREIVTKLGIAVSRLVATVEGEAEATKAAAAAQIDAGRRWLLVVAALTFVGPLAIVWLAVSRTIVAPLARLAAATRRIADGELHTPIPPARHREFHEIAEALAVFRDTTAALAERTRALGASEEAQRQAREEAERALADLRAAQEQLIQSEKMAALASVVAGVAHEVNTPVGITLTSASLLEEELAGMAARLRDGTLRRSEFEQFLDRTREIAGLIQTNMDRAAGLIQAFKQVAADQSSERRRLFDLGETIEHTLVSIRPACDRAGHAIRWRCPPGLTLDSYPGALSQVLTILAMNSLDHAFPPGRSGTVSIAAEADGPDAVRIDYRDDGTGVPAALRRRVFEPFFTTRRHQGNTGLGLHIAFNVAQQTLRGRLELHAAEAGGGVHFTLRIPTTLGPTSPPDGPARPAEVAQQNRPTEDVDLP
ncbi:ATP-binding protein [Azospirillum sp. ST 5-10]|uniref:ATP-binding protein n=1 Tax=unclassified Azospirillum TaxID=2630922 RepID=UPI003F49D9DB